MSAIKPRLIIAVEGTLAAVRLVPHKTSADHVVIKALMPESIIAFCEMLNLETPEIQTGKNFIVASVDKLQLIENLKPFIGELLKLGADNATESAVDTKCEDCGNADGTHWNFCNQQNVH